MARQSHQSVEPDRPAIGEGDLDALLAEHARWRKLGARLEKMADALPVIPDMIERAALRAELREAFPDASPVTWLSQLFIKECGEPEVALLVERLAEWRAALFVHAQDLSEATESDRPRPDMLGYMLRAVFGGCSELAALEEFALLLIAPGRLTEGARRLLLERLD